MSPTAGMTSASEALPTNSHYPVMVAEVLAGLAIQPNGTYIDATFGGGGHTRAILAKLGPQGKVVAVDADATCKKNVSALADNRVQLWHRNFRELAAVAQPAQVDGVVFDLGLSTLQLTEPERGFTFMADGPLDMRLDQSSGSSLAQLLRRIPEKTLGKIIRDYGEERRWRRVAAAIIRRRRDRKLRTTTDLVEACLQGAGTGKWQRIHPATRTFQALRIWVNDELSALVAGLDAAATLLRPQGRLVVISFHSLEDRIVKKFLRPQTGVAGPLVQVGRLHRPSKEETQANRASRSARLRVGVKQ